MKVIPYNWHTKAELNDMETSVKLELHAIIKSHGDNSEEFWDKHKELVGIQEALYSQQSKQASHA